MATEQNDNFVLNHINELVKEACEGMNGTSTDFIKFCIPTLIMYSSHIMCIINSNHRTLSFHHICLHATT